MKFTKIKVKNFRSLKDINVRDLSEINMVFGMNNSGKSNFLKFLETIFKRKEKKEYVTFQEGSDEITEEVEASLVNFWEGFIYNSPFLFWKNETANNIIFEVTIEVNDNKISEVDSEFNNDIASAGFFEGCTAKQFQFKGFIKSAGDFDSEIILECVKLGNNEIYKFNEDGTPIYFPGFPDLLDKYSEDFLWQLISIFNDCVELIDSDRYFKLENQITDNKNVKLTPNSLKNWLFDKYLNSKSYQYFLDLQHFLRQIEIGSNLQSKTDGKLDNFPLTHLEIGFTKFGKELEIMLSTGFGRFPLKNHGTGVQQLIYLFSKIYESKSKIFLVEEVELNLSKEYQEVIIHNIRRLINTEILDQFIFTSHSDIFKRNDYTNYEVSVAGNGATQIRKIENIRSYFDKMASSKN